MPKPPFPALVTLLILLLTTSLNTWAGEHILTGQTMGTFYTIKFISAKKESLSLWQKKVDIRLEEVNKRLSIFDPDSEISRFNHSPENIPFAMSQDFYQVLKDCQIIFQQTKGAWDGTVKPLVDLWGFGTKNRAEDLPLPGKIHQALDRTGFQHLVLGDKILIKKKSDITLDLGSIAKGYGVDEIGRVFSGAGIKNFLIEIGGELKASGKNKKNMAWTVGITLPEKNSLAHPIYQVVSLENTAIATSGNYRNFFEQNGRFYSHIIDPKTGYPVKNQVVSASVIAPACALADGLATALMVMDIDKGIDLINAIPGTECLIIQKTGKNFKAFRSEGFSVFER